MMYDEDIGNQLMVFELFRELWISFRGTQVRSIEGLKKDIEIDLDMKQTLTDYLKHETCYVHSGFNHSM